MRFRAIALVLLMQFGLLGLPHAHAVTDVECVVSGNAGEFQIVKLDIGWPGIGMSMKQELTWPFYGVTNSTNYHMFGGMWIVNANDLVRHSFGFIDAGAGLSPPHVQVTYGGEEQSQDVPSTDLLVDGLQGAYHVQPTIHGSYYIIGFGEGGGTWKGTVKLYGDAPVTCGEEVHVDGRVVRFNATNFSGGTQVHLPGYGSASNAKLEFTQPYRYSLGAYFAYQPAPFPPAYSIVEKGSVVHGYENVILSGGFPQGPNRITMNYTGKTNTILLELLELDLSPGA